MISSLHNGEPHFANAIMSWMRYTGLPTRRSRPATWTAIEVTIAMHQNLFLRMSVHLHHANPFRGQRYSGWQGWVCQARAKTTARHRCQISKGREVEHLMCGWGLMDWTNTTTPAEEPYTRPGMHRRREATSNKNYTTSYLICLSPQVVSIGAIQSPTNAPPSPSQIKQNRNSHLQATGRTPSPNTTPQEEFLPN